MLRQYSLISLDSRCIYSSTTPLSHSNFSFKTCYPWKETFEPSDHTKKHLQSKFQNAWLHFNLPIAICTQFWHVATCSIFFWRPSVLFNFCLAINSWLPFQKFWRSLLSSTDSCWNLGNSWNSRGINFGTGVCQIDYTILAECRTEFKFCQNGSRIHMDGMAPGTTGTESSMPKLSISKCQHLVWVSSTHQFVLPQPPPPPPSTTPIHHNLLTTIASLPPSHHHHHHHWPPRSTSIAHNHHNAWQH